MGFFVVEKVDFLKLLKLKSLFSLDMFNLMSIDKFLRLSFAWLLDQGHSYKTAINIFQPIFLSNHKASWTQIT